MSATIGPAGGALRFAGGGLLVVPAGAVTTPVVMTVSRIDNISTSGLVAVGDAWRIEPTDLRLAFPAILTLPFEPKRVPTGSVTAEVRMFLAAASTNTWAALPTELSDQSHGRAPTDQGGDYVCGLSYGSAGQDAGSDTRDAEKERTSADAADGVITDLADVPDVMVGPRDTLVADASTDAASDEPVGDATTDGRSSCTPSAWNSELVFSPKGAGLADGMLVADATGGLHVLVRHVPYEPTLSLI